MQRLFSGPMPADIMVIGDAPLPEDFSKNAPFSDYSQGSVLGKAFSAMRLAQTASFLTYVATEPAQDEDAKLLSTNKRCPGVGWEYENGIWASPQLLADKRSLLELIGRVRPKIIIACGSLALWATTGHTEATKWRGSRLQPPAMPCPVLPTLSLSAPVTQPEMAQIILMDFRRARKIYDGTQLPRAYRFIIEPTFAESVDCLHELLAKAASGPLRLSGDLETRIGHIACFGIAWSAVDAICIPMLVIGKENPFYWSEEQEAELLSLFQLLFRHPNILWVGQNYLYDCQYFARHWGFLPDRVFDTMIGHHAIYSNMRKGLDFLSSMYADDHVYWKDESKDWDPTIGEKQYWTYNCKDACITWEITDPIIESQKSRANPPHCDFQQALRSRI